jgi:hypothetical protein
MIYRPKGRSMLNFRSGLIATAALLAASSMNASANTYDFTYTFSDTGSSYSGYEIVGSFTGTPSVSNSNDVIDISNVSAKLLNSGAGVVIPSLGPLSVYSYIGPPNQGGPGNFQSGGAVASFNGFDNNFVFGNGTFSAWNDYFYIIQPWYNGGPGSTYIAAQFYTSNGTTLPGNYIDYYNGQYLPSQFTLAQTPLPSTWTMMLLGFVGLGFFVYRGAKTNLAALPAGLIKTRHGISERSLRSGFFFLAASKTRQSASSSARDIQFALWIPVASK